jgi:hypothetical protein
MVTTKTRTMWWVVRKNYQECQNLQTKIEKMYLGEEQPVCMHTHKTKLYMVLGMDVESQMEEPNEKSIVKSG